MSVYRLHGPVKKLGGVLYETGLQIRQIDLRPVNRISYKFDPFHPTSANFRKIMYIFSAPKIRETNFKCMFKTEVVCDNTEPVMLCELANGARLKFEASNLTPLELISNFNRIVLPLVPPPEDISESIPKTKSQKKGKK